MKKPIDFYNQEYYEEHEFSYVTEDRADIKRILQLLKPAAKDRVLEIGCGLGILLQKIRSKNKVGIETNDYAITECKKRGLSVIRADAERGLPFEDSSFDMVIMNEVISHLEKPEKVLKECYRVISARGKIILTAPVKSRFFHDISETHLHEMSVQQLRELVEKNGFKIVSHEVNGISFIYPLLENFFYKPFRGVRNLFQDQKKEHPSNTSEVQVATGSIDRFHGLVDKTLLLPLNIYRNQFLELGLNQIILAEKIR